MMTASLRMGSSANRPRPPVLAPVRSFGKYLLIKRPQVEMCTGISDLDLRLAPILRFPCPGRNGFANLGCHGWQPGGAPSHSSEDAHRRAPFRGIVSANVAWAKGAASRDGGFGFPGRGGSRMARRRHCPPRSRWPSASSQRWDRCYFLCGPQWKAAFRTRRPSLRSRASPGGNIQGHQVFWEGIEENLVGQVFRFETENPRS
jgi:hypothetical protein